MGTGPGLWEREEVGAAEAATTLQIDNHRKLVRSLIYWNLGALKASGTARPPCLASTPKARWM